MTSTRFLAFSVFFLMFIGLAGCSDGVSPLSSRQDPAKKDRGREEFQNAGGMWMPSQLKHHRETLLKLGVKNPENFENLLGHPMGAIVSLGYCSASFVSPDGLIVTNHHCMSRMRQYIAEQDKDLNPKRAFLAKSRDDERPAGPSERVFVTSAFREVTKQVIGGLAEIADPAERLKELDRRQKRLLAACEKDRPGIRCRIAGFFEDSEFYQIEQLEIRDVRVVHIPDERVGFFGGFADNWQWPRHVGDYSFIRAYVGRNGKPADFNVANVPYRPQYHLKLASTPTREKDFALVAGYPGVTYRLKTSDEVNDSVASLLPYNIDRNKAHIELLNTLSKTDPAIEKKAAPVVFSYTNRLQKFETQLVQLGKGGLAAQKSKAEAAFKAAVPAVGPVLATMAKVRAEARKDRRRDLAMLEVVYGGGTLLEAALDIVRMAEARPKADEERPLTYQARNWPQLKSRQAGLQATYDRRIDRAVMNLYLGRTAALPVDAKPKVLTDIVGAQHDAPALTAALERLYAGTQLENKDERLRLFDNATTEELQKSNDTVIRAALAVLPAVKEYEEREARVAGSLLLLRPQYVAALRQYNGGAIAPDANSTLRITFGTVRGYRPSPTAQVYRPFTTLSEMVKKHSGVDPFELQPALIRAAMLGFQTGNFGPYVASELREVPVDFLADLDITGGNSGSATLNAAGELTGLAFDGNSEAMASDWTFLPEVQRSIHTDSRFMLWVMDAVDGAHDVLRELERTPVFPR